MEPGLWQRVEEVVQQALELDKSRRGEFLESSCRGDEALRREVESLLAQDKRGNHFLDSPALQAASKLAVEQVMSAEANLIGATVSHYRLVQKIGSGGMGVVYKAEDTRLHRFVALKFLPERFARDPQRVMRFEREAQAASALNHPNICTIYDIGEHEGQPVIVMELLHGKTLREHLRDGAFQMNDPAALDIAIQVASGLEAAHEKGIIHRDIKPANIFITERHVAKILDFGVAKVLGIDEVQQFTVAAGKEGITSRPAAGELTSTGIKPGTAGYMSPEQIRCQPLDARTDIFSFAMVLYEMATGQRAFSGETVAMVQDAVLHREPTAVRQVNPELPVELEGIISKGLQKDPSLRYQHAAEIRSDLQQLQQASDSHVQPSLLARQRAPAGTKGRPWWMTTAAIVLVLALIAVYFVSRRPSKLSHKDTIVVADLTNTTGDRVFDDTLKQGLSVQLEQSPFLKLVSESKANNTLKLMGRPAGNSVTAEVAREICQRTGSKATLTGSIATLGSQYVIGLKAVDCQTGDTLAEAQQQAPSKEAVLKALDTAAATMRGRLGESLSSVQRYGTPLAEATTPSLEALKAYSLGRKMAYARGNTAALPFFKRAVELDPNFAMAYRAMSIAYMNLNEVGRASANGRKAFELRGKVSERERFLIDANYYFFTTGELEKAAQVYELWLQTYPGEDAPVSYLGLVSDVLGNFEKALEEAKEAIRLDPDDAYNYVNLSGEYMNLNRLEEAETVFKQAEERKLEKQYMLFNRYTLAFLKGDKAQMARLSASAQGKPGAEDRLLSVQADTEAWYGKLERARELTRRAMDSAQHNDAKESAAMYQAAAGLREVESGNRARARDNVGAALKLAPNRDVRAIAALVLAAAGDTAAAEKLAAELDKAFPLGTLVQRYWLPTIRAGVALERKDPKRAIELLQASSTIELGQPTQVNVFLCPVYLRGQAYLMLHDGNAAAAEFQKFIDHQGVVQNFPWGALARLELARAYAIQGDTTKARAAYQDFLRLWKDADPGVPILKQAKTEYAKLQN